VFKEALRRVSTAELLAMHEHFEDIERDGREEWSEEGEPLMRLLLALMQKARHDEPGEFPWRSKTHGREEQSRGEYLETRVKRLEDAGGAESARRAPVPRWSTSTAR
jgi:hypothetical protein